MINAFRISLTASRIIAGIIITGWIAGCILWSSLHLIATDGSGEYFQVHYVSLVVPLIVVYFLRLTDRWWHVLLKMIGVGVATFIVMILSFPLIFAAMCVESVEEISYRSRSEHAKIIVRTEYGCGAMDGSPASISTAYARQLTSHIFMIGARVDAAMIDTVQWVRVEERVWRSSR